MSTEAGNVIVEKVGNKGIIILDRPRALNALSLSMIRQIYQTLKKWRTDPSMKMVIIKAKKDSKAFSVGGDVKVVVKSKGQDNDLTDIFFREVYILNNLIGFFPDTGSSYVFPRLPGKLGLFLGLTGYRLAGWDIFRGRIVTHFSSSQRSEPDFRREPDFEQLMGHINSFFNAPSVEAIIENLSKDTSEWAQEQAQILKMAPLSLKVTFRAFEEGSKLTLEEVQKMEFRLSQRFMQDSDFYEGVGAVLIHRSGNPKWNPATLAEVTEEKLDSYFKLLPADKELRF
ncbi:unnamed protein product [Ixodes hexagonus]